jgi:hypothetical protein
MFISENLSDIDGWIELGIMKIQAGGMQRSQME